MYRQHLASSLAWSGEGWGAEEHEMAAVYEISCLKLVTDSEMHARQHNILFSHLMIKLIQSVYSGSHTDGASAPGPTRLRGPTAAPSETFDIKVCTLQIIRDLTILPPIPLRLYTLRYWSNPHF